MSTSLPILDKNGGEAGTFEVDPLWLEREKGQQAVHDTVVAFLCGKRAGTASTRTRSEVRGGGAKPYRQKGTGRARAGSIRSPIWRGGGVVFGPKPRSFAKRVNRKVKLLALRRAFTERVDEGAVIVVDDVSVDGAKTKQMVAFLDAVGAGEDALIVAEGLHSSAQLAARNLAGIAVMRPASVNAYWTLLFKKIVITQKALEALGQRLARQEKAK